MVISTLASALAVNRRASAAIGRLWPYSGTRIFDLYPHLVAEYACRLPAPVIGDVGAGADSSFARYFPPRARVIGVDVSASDMARNVWLTERRVADVATTLPLGDAELDLLVSRSVLEHLPDVPAFVSQSRGALKPGGHAIHLFSTRAAPFAVANRLLPSTLGRRVLYGLHPEATGTQGFRAYYDCCSYEASRALMLAAGFRIELVRISYRTSQYFDFCAPLFVFARSYEDLLARLDVRRLASYVLVVCSRGDEPGLRG